MERWRAWILGGLAVTVLVCGFAAIWLRTHWPFTPEAITSLLQQRFSRQVVIGSFRETWFPPGCVAREVRFLHRVRKDLPPLIEARELAVKTTWAGILRHHIDKVEIAGLRATVASADESGELPALPKNKSSGPEVTSIDEVEADNANLMFLPKASGGTATSIQIHQLKLDHLSPGEPLAFHVSLRYSRPAGELNASGQLGPWKKEHLADTPLSGQYRFRDADLKTFHGLSGMLATGGKFNGVLARIALAGSADVPGFHVDGSARKVRLMARYRVSIDTRTADTQLNIVEAHIGRTTIVANGEVAGRQNEQGKTASVNLQVEQGRIEDLLNYFSEERQASMVGEVSLHAHAELPPGSGFLKRIRLTGGFSVADARFTNPKRQAPVNHLSLSAAGENKKEQDEDLRDVPAKMNGSVSARNGLASLSNLSFDFPGADARMNGTFNLLSKVVDLRGTLRTEGKLADTSSGFKSLLLRIATPFLRKHKLDMVPFKIEGNASNPSVGLDLGGGK